MRIDRGTPALRRPVVFFIALAALWISGSGLTLAHEGLQHLLGVVHGRSAGQLQVQTAEGRIVSVVLDSQTRYEKDEKAASAGELESGARVIVEAEDVEGLLHARVVRIGVVAPLSKPAPVSRGDTPPVSHHEPVPTSPGTGPGHAGQHAATPDSAGVPMDHAQAGHHEAAPDSDGVTMDHGQGGRHETMPASSAGMDHRHGGPVMTPMAGRRDERALFQSDMSEMAGMTAHDPMAGMPMPGWQFMTAGVARLQYNRQGGPSGDEAVESTNWSMVMLQHDLGVGRLTLMMMNSLEPATIEKAGSPELFQTGETFEGRPLVDRQHAHDLFMNLSAAYRAPWGTSAAYWFQAALRGEPALGPTAFMHRASSGENPTAALGHHQQDATHITDDVLTVGLARGRASIEGSIFHGAEPDEDRWDLDGGALDSGSGRLKFDLSDGWSVQVSHGFLKEPEGVDAGDLRRTTASVHYGAAGDRPLAASLVWGRNREDHGTFSSILLECAYRITTKDQVYGRAEQVDRPSFLLLTKGVFEPPPTPGPPDVAIVGVRALTVGYLRDFSIWNTLLTGVGADVTAYDFPDRLKDVYGESPVSLHLFLRLRWESGHGSGNSQGMVH